ncbi:MAG: cofactor-independent phosphoglycerate mutase [bacterium]
MSKTKYVVLLGDGMADDPQPERDEKTPLELARTPALDRIAQAGEMGLVQTVPPDMEPGSDVANMSVLGYEPKKYYTGRAAIEAAALGIELTPGEAAFRCNLVSFSGEPPELYMADYSGGHPSSEEQKAIVELLNQELAGFNARFIPGVSFRNLCVISEFSGEPDLKPPHDHAGAAIQDIRPEGPGSDIFREIQEKARLLLQDHPLNKEREKQGKPPVNGIWLWGMGTAGSMPSFYERYHKTGAVVTGVDLIRGLARLLGLDIINVPGATGYVDTDFEGKAKAVLEALQKTDFVFLHVEAPDESGHEGDLDLKIRAIEDFDRRAVRPVLEGLQSFPDYRVLLLPDHETPVQQRCHRGGPVPYAVADRQALQNPPHPGRPFTESAARKAGSDIVEGPRLLESKLFS